MRVVESTILATAFPFTLDGTKMNSMHNQILKRFKMHCSDCYRIIMFFHTEIADFHSSTERGGSPRIIYPNQNI